MNPFEQHMQSLADLWNQSGKAIPPWSEAELLHKLRDAFSR